MALQWPAGRRVRHWTIADASEHLHALIAGGAKQFVDAPILPGHFGIFLQGLAGGVYFETERGGEQIHPHIAASGGELIGAAVASGDQPNGGGQRAIDAKLLFKVSTAVGFR